MRTRQSVIPRRLRYSRDIPACDVSDGIVSRVSTPPSDGALIGSSVALRNRFAASAPPESS